MAPQLLVYLVLVAAVTRVHCNLEGDALNAWKTKLDDPYMVLQSWNATLVNPCTWLHITCNSENSVIRVDLGNSGVSGPLVPQLGVLTNLQHLQVFENKLRGFIPTEIGNLTSLISLGLQQNELSGQIPASLGNLASLWFLRLDSNKLSGKLPIEVIHLIQSGNLRVMNVSDNMLSGTVHPINSTGYAITTIIQDPKAQKRKN